MRYSEYLMPLLTERNTGEYHRITRQKCNILIGEFEIEVLYCKIPLCKKRRTQPDNKSSYAEMFVFLIDCENNQFLKK